MAMLRRSGVSHDRRTPLVGPGYPPGCTSICHAVDSRPTQGYRDRHSTKDERRLPMIRGYAAVKGNLRRPRKGAIVYKRPEVAVVFGALEAVPGGALFEGSVSDISSPAVGQGGLLFKGTFTADPIPHL